MPDYLIVTATIVAIGLQGSLICHRMLRETRGTYGRKQKKLDRLAGRCVRLLVVAIAVAATI